MPFVQGYSPEMEMLHNAIKNNNFQSVKKIVESGVDVNEELTASYSLPALFLAIELHNVHIAQYLINNGADVNIEIGFYTPLIYANSCNSAELVKLLITNGARINRTHSVTDSSLLLEAIYSNNFYIIKYVIMQGANVNQTGMWGRTPLLWAIHNNNFDLAKLLISNGADVSKADSNGATPLAVARRLQLPQIVEFLETYTKLYSSQDSLTTTRHSGNLDFAKTILGRSSAHEAFDGM